MTAAELEPQIQEIVSGICFSSVEKTQPLLSSQLLDSIGVVDLIVQLEEKFGVQFDLNLMRDGQFDTVEQLAGEVLRQMQSKGGNA